MHEIENTMSNYGLSVYALEKASLVYISRQETGDIIITIYF